MNQSITITLNKQQTDRLSRMALRYGLSLKEFTHKILNELEDSFPKESLSEYKNPKALQASLNRALKDWQTGRVRTKL